MPDSEPNVIDGASTPDERGNGAGAGNGAGNVGANGGGPPATSGGASPATGEALVADVVELVFKGRRRAYYANPREIPLRDGDYVIVQAERGEDLGRVHHTAEWVRRPEMYGSLRHVLRAARPEDLEILDRNRGKEERAFQICRDRILQRDIEMKLVDCEYQLDGNRVTFYFTAEKRVDFRDLVKDLAAAFRTRIELRQIGVRDEAGRIGGVGTCGRELCCSTWLRQFEPITLKMAKDQGLSPSPSKISGACGRLKCCLRYELDFYKEVAREFPKIGSKITLMDGDWEVGRVDIFRREIHLVTDEGKESMIALEAIPAGTRIVGPSRDRRKGCDKEGCASRGARPGDGESGPRERGGGDRERGSGDRERGGGARGGPGDRRPQRPGDQRRGRPGGEQRGPDRGRDRGPGGGERGPGGGDRGASGERGPGGPTGGDQGRDRPAPDDAPEERG